MFREFYNAVLQPPFCKSEGRGGWGPARTALRTLRAKAECAYMGFHLYCFPFCHLLILWIHCLDVRKSEKGQQQNS